jgi:stearoyl-CoA desaturase (delta-9 desaturase)
MVGDELHSNHHAHPNNPNNKYRWFEFDLGFIYIKIFEKLGLLTVNKRT